MLLERNLGKSKLFTLPMATVKNRMCVKKKKKKRMTYLVKTAGVGEEGGNSRSRMQCIWTGHGGSGLLFTKTGLDYEQWQEAKTSIITHKHTSPNPSSTEAINQSTPPSSVINPTIFAAKWIEGPSSIDQADDIKKIPQAQWELQTTSNLLRDKTAAHFKLLTLPPPQAIIRGEAWPFPSLLW